MRDEGVKTLLSDRSFQAWFGVGSTPSEMTATSRFDVEWFYGSVITSASDFCSRDSVHRVLEESKTVLSLGKALMGDPSIKCRSFLSSEGYQVFLEEHDSDSFFGICKVPNENSHPGDSADEQDLTPLVIDYYASLSTRNFKDSTVRTDICESLRQLFGTEDDAPRLLQSLVVADKESEAVVRARDLLTSFDLKPAIIVFEDRHLVAARGLSAVDCRMLLLVHDLMRGSIVADSRRKLLRAMINLDEGQQVFGIEMNGMKVIEVNSSDQLGALQDDIEFSTALKLLQVCLNRGSVVEDGSRVMLYDVATSGSVLSNPAMDSRAYAELKELQNMVSELVLADHDPVVATKRKQGRAPMVYTRWTRLPTDEEDSSRPTRAFEEFADGKDRKRCN
ncbi:hypothetical protein NDN08_003891 [Rhodosorus marinus]|uniref:Inositol-pentakisphosphate 2-kinase n=1 Tax=Rhodosorus marinus TaxID=101924 RepID=A0AAV8UGQ9_9RHOD|nr:hypothetical protein NDN08_003891 [Rhodosorus marinus]